MPRVCETDGCGKPYLGRGYCKMHYSRWYREVGVKSARPKRPANERFWPKVLRLEPDDCWEWQGYRKRDGYGDFQMSETRKIVAHRFAYMDANGSIPNDMQVDHVCFNRACVNPAHLRLATNKQNHENLRGATARSKTGVRGVFPRGDGRFVAAVKHNGVRVYEQVFDSLEEAAKAVGEARQRIFTHSQEKYDLPVA